MSGRAASGTGEPWLRCPRWPARLHRSGAPKSVQWIRCHTESWPGGSVSSSGRAWPTSDVGTSYALPPPKHSRQLTQSALPVKYAYPIGCAADCWKGHADAATAGNCFQGCSSVGFPSMMVLACSVVDATTGVGSDCSTAVCARSACRRRRAVRCRHPL
jgi:hypothetical protein